jgi:Uma2 family endonuclease
MAVVHGEPRDYRDGHPSRAALVVEVADSTLDFDRGRKLALYARCGVPEVWIVNLIDVALEVHREPSGASYLVAMTLSSGDFVSPQAGPHERIAVVDLLP